MTRVTTRRVLTLSLLLVASMVVPAAPGVAAEVPPPETVLEGLGGLEEREAEIVEVPPSGDLPAVADDPGDELPGEDALDAAGDDETADAEDNETADAEDDETADAEADADPEESVTTDGEDGEAVRVSTSEPTPTPIPFSMVAFKLPDGLDEVEFRTHGPEGWSAWQVAVRMDVDDGPDPGTDEAAASDVRATEAVWVGEGDQVQIRAVGARTSDVEVYVIDSMGLSESFFAKTARYLRPRPVAAEASLGAPAIVTRAQWGADESKRSGSPRYITPRYAVVHHTAGTNNYTRAQSAGIVRGVYNWHTDGNGWNDIGYNLLIDRYGTVYEGRYGGVTSGVQGAHASGHNSDSFGVSIMGNFDQAQPPKVAVDRLVDVIAWKFDVHEIDADPSRLVTGAGTNNRTIPVVVGHRDVGSTACPGRYLASQLSQIRDRVAVQVMSGGSWVALSGDWNGDGQHTPAWFARGRWYLMSSSGAVTSFAYGSTGDVPITGDWNGNGRHGIGIVRNGRWHLRNDLSGGSAQLPVFTFGRVTQGDVPFTGDWDGNGRYGIGIVRNGRWHLRYTPSGGSAHIDPFTFGRVNDGDLPVTGDWNRSGRHGIGIVRGPEWHLRNSLSGGSAQVYYGP